MLVSLYPAISNNNQSKAQSFKANPYMNISKISSVAQAYHFEELVMPGFKKIERTPEEEAILDSTIQRCLKDGQKTVVSILNRAKKTITGSVNVLPLMNFIPQLC